jgi:hypothetical protein
MPLNVELSKYPPRGTKQLTISMELSIIREIRRVWTLDSFPTFYGTRRFNTEFTRALHLSLS